MSTTRLAPAGPRSELRYILNLALPVIAAELGWIFMGVVDTIMVGPLGPSVIGAVSLGNAMFDVAAIFGIGLLLGLDTVVSQSFGAGRIAECDSWLWQGCFLALAATPLLMGMVEASIPLMSSFGVNPEVLSTSVPYLRAVNWSLPPLLLYAAFRRYLQGMSRVWPVMIALLTANIVNAAGNYVLLPAFGVAGVGWSTCISRLYMLSVLAAYAFLREPVLMRRVEPPRLAAFRELLRLGLPAAGQILLEVGVFATATVLAGKLQPDSLAAHHIVLNVAGTTFMVPLGLSSAGAVVVGQAIGSGDPQRAKRSGWITIGLAAAFMSIAALCFLVIPSHIIRVFTRDAGVLAIAVPLLFVAAVFQIFDGVQVTITGVLRGTGDTRTPMLANLVAHWLLGLPAGYLLCFVIGYGVSGLWMGLSFGLIIVGTVLLLVWSRRSPGSSS